MKHDSDILKRIKNYFMRRRSAQEAYDFEREAERDPFLYEAMEGFEDMLAPEIQQSLDELDDMLDRKTKRKRGIIWWQAAGVAVVIATGASLYAILSDGPDTASSEPDMVLEETEAKTSDERYEPRVIQPQFEAWSDSITDFAYGSEPTSATLEEMAGEEEVFSSPVEQNGEPQEALKKPEALEDLQPESNTALKEEKTAVPIEAAKRKDVALDEIERDNEADTDNTYKWDGRAEENEAVSQGAQSVPPSNAEKVRKAEEAQSERAVTTSEIVNASTSDVKRNVPVEGMAAYRQYLRNNLKTSDGMPKGTVIVTFEFDRNGTPKKLEVTKSLCTACDAEAIRLIENGPKWNVEDRKQPATIEVVFP